MPTAKTYRESKINLTDYYIKNLISSRTGIKSRFITDAMITARRNNIIAGITSNTKEENDFLEMRDIVEVTILETGGSLEKRIRMIVGAANDIRFNQKVSKKKWRELLGWYRWNGNPICPLCGCDRYYFLNDGRYDCANQLCGARFTETTGTIFADTKLSIAHWMVALNVVTGNFYMPSRQFPKNGITTQKSAWFMLDRLKQFINPNIKDVWYQLEHLIKVPFWDVNEQPDIQKTKNIIRKLNHQIYANQHRKTK